MFPHHNASTGPKCRPTSTSSVDAYALESFFAGNNITTDADKHPFRCKGSWTSPSGREPALDTFINAIQQDLMFSQPTIIHDNLPKEECEAIKNLQNRV